MRHAEDAEKLLNNAEHELREIEAEYQASITSRTVSNELLIAIKNFMENIRSSLDFIAHEVYSKYCPHQQTPPRIYFPYASASQSEQDFRLSSRVEQRIPGLTSSRPDIVERIISFQHFASADNAWLPQFMALCNENKHQRLSPQTRKERKELRISSRGGSAAFGEGASVTLGPGASMRVGDLTIRGPQGFDAGNPPSATGDGKIETIVWVSFHFTDGDVPVLPFLTSALMGARRIVNELSLI